MNPYAMALVVNAQQNGKLDKLDNKCRGAGGCSTSKMIEECIPWGMYLRAGCRMWPLFFRSAALIAPGGGDLVISPPQYPFQAEVFSVPSALGTVFELTISIATQTQQARAGFMLAQAFSEDADLNWVNFDPVDANTEIQIQVVNVSADFGLPLTRRFYAMMLGRVQK